MSEITHNADGSIDVVFPDCQLSILPDGESKAFIRNGIKMQLGGKEKRPQEHVRYIVGELDGVRVYIQGTNVILTRRDLYP